MRIFDNVSVRLSFSYLLAMTMAVIPLPGVWQWLRPDFVLVLTSFWVLTRPQHFGVGFGWFMGFLMDGVEGGVLGPHALSLSLIAYILIVLNQQIRMYSFVQQSAVIFLLGLLDQLVASWMSALCGYTPHNLLYFMPAVTSAMLWPIMFYFIKRNTVRFSR